MKTMTKKLGAIVLALAMCFSLCATALAASDNCSITIENSVLGSTYYVYKIFDATYNTEADAVSYTIKSTDPWYSLVTSDTGKQFFSLQESTDASGDTYYAVQRVEGSDDDALISWLKSCITVNEETGTATLSNGATISPVNEGGTKGNGGSVTISDLQSGYYFVSTTTGTTVSVTTADPDATIIDKNVPISVEKVITHDDGSADTTAEADGMGETVKFDVTANVPMYEDENYVLDYTLTDSLTNGLLIELTEGQFYGENGKYYLINDMINDWITLYDGAGEEVVNFTDYVYNYTFELEGHDVYTDETTGTEYHTFSGFTLTYYTYDVTAYQSALRTALQEAGYNVDEIWPSGQEWPTEGSIRADFDFPSESYFTSSKYPVNASIEIAYSAHVSSLEGYENTNTITLDHQVTPFNHPTPWEPEDGEQYEKIDYVYSWELQILKVDGKDEMTPLEGAVFTLESKNMIDVKIGHTWLYVSLNGFDESGNYTYTDPDTGVTTVYNKTEFESTHYVKIGDNEYEVGEGTSESDTFVRILIDDSVEEPDPTTYSVTGTTDANGELYFEGLGTGEYVLTEIVAPDGYNLLENPIYFKIEWYSENSEYEGNNNFFVVFNALYNADGSVMKDGDGNIIYAEGGNVLTDNYILMERISDYSGTELPSTGGIGTTIFYIIGGVLVAGAVVVLVTRRRMTRGED